MHNFIIAVIVLFYSQISFAIYLDDNYRATCVGIEVIGVDSKTADKIRENMPLKQGDAYIASDDGKLEPICTQRIKMLLPHSSPNCSFLIYGNNSVYLVVDVATSNLEFREIPDKNDKVVKLPKILIDLYDKWDERKSYLVNNGEFPKESYDKGYIDYNDPILHDLANQLSEHAWKNNDILLDIVTYSTDPDERSKAAMLFAWARHPQNLSTILDRNILFDPDKGVRNNIARAFSFTLSQSKDEILLKKALPAYCKLINQPSHLDRNKGLVSLSKILSANPHLSTSLDSDCKEQILYISQASILDNVGGVAKDIVKIVKKSENG